MSLGTKDALGESEPCWKRNRNRAGHSDCPRANEPIEIGARKRPEPDESLLGGDFPRAASAGAGAADQSSAAIEEVLLEDGEDPAAVLYMSRIREALHEGNPDVRAGAFAPDEGSARRIRSSWRRPRALSREERLNDSRRVKPAERRAADGIEAHWSFAYACLGRRVHLIAPGRSQSHSDCSLLRPMSAPRCLSAELRAEDDYEFQSGTSLLAEGFAGLAAEPGKETAIEPVDGAGGFENVAPRLGAEEGPGGLRSGIPLRPTGRGTRAGRTTRPGASAGPGEQLVHGIPYAVLRRGVPNQCRVRFDANTFRVYTHPEPTTRSGVGASRTRTLRSCASPGMLNDDSSSTTSTGRPTPSRRRTISSARRSKGGGAHITITYNTGSSSSSRSQVRLEARSGGSRTRSQLKPDRQDRHRGEDLL